MQVSIPYEKEGITFLGELGLARPTLIYRAGRWGSLRIIAVMK